MVRVVHMNQGSQADASLPFGTLLLVELGDLKKRARVVGEQVVVPFDIHHVGVFGNRPERCVRGYVHPGHWFVRTCIGERLIQAFLIGVGLRLSQHPGGGFCGSCAHLVLLVDDLVGQCEEPRLRVDPGGRQNL